MDRPAKNRPSFGGSLVSPTSHCQGRRAVDCGLLEKLKNSKVNIRTPLKNYRRGFARQTLSERQADVPQKWPCRAASARRAASIDFLNQNRNAKTKPTQNQQMKRKLIHNGLSLLIATAALLGVVGSVVAADKKPNIVILMTDDVGWSDFGYISGRAADLGQPT